MVIITIIVMMIMKAAAGANNIDREGCKASPEGE
jgi:hypothetical protein